MKAEWEFPLEHSPSELPIEEYLRVRLPQIFLATGVIRSYRIPGPYFQFLLNSLGSKASISDDGGIYFTVAFKGCLHHVSIKPYLDSCCICGGEKK